MPRVRVGPGVHAAVEVGAGRTERPEDAAGVGEKRRVEDRRDRRRHRQAHEGRPPPLPAGHRGPRPFGSQRPPGDRAGCERGREHDDRRFLGRDGQACGNARQRRPHEAAARRHASDGDHERQREAGKHRLLDVHPGVEDHRRRQRHQDRARRDRRAADAGEQERQQQNRCRAERRPSRRVSCVRRATRASSGRAATPPAATGSRASGRDGRGRRSGTRRARAARRT